MTFHSLQGSPLAAYATKGKHAFKLPLFIYLLLTWFEFEHINWSSALTIWNSTKASCRLLWRRHFQFSPARPVMQYLLNEALKRISLDFPSGCPGQRGTTLNQLSATARPVGKLLGFWSWPGPLREDPGVSFESFRVSGSSLDVRTSPRSWGDEARWCTQETGSLGNHPPV